MSFLAIAGWILLGSVAVSCLVAFWDSIKNWLNTTAADVVERHLGYNARMHMLNATSMITRIRDRVFNQTIVISQCPTNSNYYDKTTLSAEDSASNIDADVLEELRKNKNELIQKFEYRS